MTTEPAFVAETLAWCNERRAEKSMEPLEKLPKGKKGDSSTCPCGAATGLYVYEDFYTTSRPMHRADRVDTPLCVIEFVSAFDNGDLPQYDESRVCESS